MPTIERDVVRVTGSTARKCVNVADGVRKWRGDEARTLIKAELTRRMKAACIVVSRYAKELVSTEGTGVKQSEPKKP